MVKKTFIPENMEQFLNDAYVLHRRLKKMFDANMLVKVMNQYFSDTKQITKNYSELTPSGLVRYIENNKQLTIHNIHANLDCILSYSKGAWFYEDTATCGIMGERELNLAFEKIDKRDFFKVMSKKLLTCQAYKEMYGVLCISVYEFSNKQMLNLC